MFDANVSGKNTLHFPAGLRRVLFFGTGPVLGEVSRFCEQHSIEQIVITAPRQEESKVEGQSLRTWARKRKVHLCIRENLTVDWLRTEFAPTLQDLGISKGSPFIFKQDEIAALHGNLINVHYSMLPKYSGGGGLSWQILAGERDGGTSVHLVTPSVDDGPLLVQHKFQFPEDLRFPIEYAQIAAKTECEVVKSFLQRLHLDREVIVGDVPDGSKKTYFPRLSTEIHGAIDWWGDAISVSRFVSAFSYPYSGAWTRLRSSKVEIMECRLVYDEADRVHPFFAGLVFRISNNEVYVFCRDSSIAIPIDAIKGDVPSEGDRFFTPRKDLDRALASRVTYNVLGLSEHRYDKS